TRRDSEDAVVMSLDHFNSMQETLYLMSSPKNAERLAESIAQLEAGNTTVRELNNDE
ncbi:type II toxin-antitoxin system Phd/YefM family antitoxin, partial [Vibrio lentus]